MTLSPTLEDVTRRLSWGVIVVAHMTSVAIRPLAAVISLATLLVTGCSPMISPSPSAIAPPSASPLRTLAPSPAAPSPTPLLPIPTVKIPASEAFTAGLLYSCDLSSFPIETFEAPGNAHLSSDPPARLVSRAGFGDAVEEGWLINRASALAEYVGRSAADNYYYMRVEFEDDIWRWTGYGDCRIRAAVPDHTVVAWWIPEGRWPSRSDRELRITVRAECPDSLEARLAEPIVRYGPDSIVVILPALWPEPEWPSCGDPEDQLERVTLQLDEPVGNRTLWDGGSWPLRDARTRTEPLIFCCG